MQLTDAYDSLQHQFISDQVSFTIDKGTTSPQDESKIEKASVHDPVGGLARDEAAELVGYEIHAIAVVTTIQSDGDDGDSRGPNSIIRNEFTADPDYSNPSEGTDVDVTTTSDSNVTVVDQDFASFAGGDDDDPDTVESFLLSTNGSLRAGNGDGVTSIGDGEYQTFVPLRSLFGEGPVYDRHDQLYWHLEPTTPNASAHEVSITVRLEAELMWDVFIDD